MKLTACTWKWMVGIRSFPFGMAYFHGRAVSFREGIHNNNLWFPKNPDPSKGAILGTLTLYRFKPLYRKVQWFRFFHIPISSGNLFFTYIPPKQKKENHERLNLVPKVVGGYGTSGGIVMSLTSCLPAANWAKRCLAKLCSWQIFSLEEVGVATKWKSVNLLVKNWYT